MSNIYLHEFDKFILREIKKFNKGLRRDSNPAYANKFKEKNQLENKMWRNDRKYGDKWDGRNELIKKIRKVKKELLDIPSKDYMDSGFKRMKYVRYVDDWICGIIGSKNDAIEIKEKFSKYLKEELDLELNTEKTLITNLKDKVSFLGYNITQWKKKRIIKMKSKTNIRPYTRRTLTKAIKIEIPNEKIYNFVKNNKYGNFDSLISKSRYKLINNSELEIMEVYNAELRGFSNYYRIADNYYYLNKMFYLAESSFIKTITMKRKSNFAKVIASMKNKIQGEIVIVYVGKKNETKIRKFIKKKHLPKIKVIAKVGYPNVDNITNTAKYSGLTELEKRLQANMCEACGRTEGNMEVHHVRKLKDIRKNKKLTKFEKIMIARNRKTLVLCEECHNLHHSQKIPINQLASRIR